jgi:hypothetical protein
MSSELDRSVGKRRNMTWNQGEEQNSIATNNIRDHSREYPDKNMNLYYCVTFFPLVAICYEFRC